MGLSLPAATFVFLDENTLRYIKKIYLCIGIVILVIIVHLYVLKA